MHEIAGEQNKNFSVLDCSKHLGIEQDVLVTQLPPILNSYVLTLIDP